MKLPVKDWRTQPYISEREIPAVKAALSAWRKLRRDKTECANIRESVEYSDCLPELSTRSMVSASWYLEYLAAIDRRKERIGKEAANAGA